MSVGNTGLFCVRESLDTQINLERQYGQIGNIGIRKAAPKVQNAKKRKKVGAELLWAINKERKGNG